MLLKYYDRLSLPVETAKGIWLDDIIDITGSLGYNTLGHGWLQDNIAVPEFLPCNKLERESETKLSELLCKTFGYDYSFQGNTGHEAVEIFLSMYCDKRKIYKLPDSFHGRTRSIKKLDIIDPDRDNGLDRYEALIFEPFQGGFGEFMELPERYVTYIKQSQENGALICADEIQTCMHKTGTMLACEHYGIKPDVLLLGKPLGQGLPISAILTNSNDNFEWSSTFAGNEICSGVAIKSLKEHIKRDNDFRDKSIKFEKMMLDFTRNVFGFSGTIHSKASIHDFIKAKVLLFDYRNNGGFKFLCPPIINGREMKTVSKRLSEVI